MCNHVEGRRSYTGSGINRCFQVFYKYIKNTKGEVKMKNVRKGISYILLVVIAIAALGYIAYAGIGEGKRGSVEYSSWS